MPIAKNRKSKKRAMTEAEYVEDDSEQAAKKAKKSKANASQENPTASDVLTIQQEAQQLDASEVLDKRTRGKKQVDTAQPSKKRKMAIKKLRQASLAAGTSTPTSSPTHASDSSDLDDVTLSLLYKNISTSSKPIQKANTKPFEPKYPAVLNNIGEMSQRRI